MGQYYKVFNLDAKEKLNPHALGDGLKLMEFGNSSCGTLSAMAILLAKGAGHEGPWAGQRIVVGGDYADEGRFVPDSHAQQNLYSYDYGEDNEDSAEEADSERSERFVEVSSKAKAFACQSLPAGHGFVVSERNAGPGVERLMSDDAVFATAEEMFAAFGAAIHEQLPVTFQEVLRSIRCSNLVSNLSWNYSPQRVLLQESEDGARIEALTVDYQLTRGDGPRTRTLKIAFPATAADVRRFCEIEGRRTSR